MGAQILLDQFPDRRLVQLHADKIGPLLEAGCPTGAVVWLDDLDEYLLDDSLRPDWIEMLRDNDNVILATMRSAEWEKHDRESHVRSKVLDSFTPTWLTYDADEAQRLGESMPSAKAASNVTRYGIGDYLGGGPRYRDRYKTGQAEHPLAVAMVRAAVDLRRAGLDPVSISRVKRLAPHYLPTSNTSIQESPDEAAAWALAPLDGLPGLIEPAHGNPTLVQAGNFILDHLPETALPGPVWDDIVNGPLTQTETITVRSFAIARKGNPTRDNSELAESQGDMRFVRRKLGGEDKVLSIYQSNDASRTDTTPSSRAEELLRE